ncbi:acylneuraminate cytidylyltransferase family protein [Flavobacterium sp.]|uniref:acylneuraminate cytidylyltransferase family protein n=1 Tax=Flavobacterium sp. TaxID=239 RepID=UPI0026132555|nr:acylneuraminate cytidylyltransferase family protein [Flavobacterium sp.]
MTNQYIAIIPARGGSKRLPGKNIRLLGDLPLLAHSIRYAQASSRIQRVIVTTDDPAIEAVALDYGAEVIQRPHEFAGDEAPTVTALQHVLGQLTDLPDGVVVLQPTNPLRPLGLLDEALDCFEQNKVSGLFTVSPNTHKLGRIQQQRFVPFNYHFGQRSQDMEPLFYENGLLYVCTPSLIDSGAVMDETCYPLVVTHPYAAVDIDTEADFVFASLCFNYYQTQPKENHP